MLDYFKSFLSASQYSEDSRRVGVYSRLFILVGLTLAILASLFSFFEPLLWAIAAFAVGSVIGFLFGIPRVLQHDGIIPNPDSEGGSLGGENAQPSLAPRYQQRVNTNLEQISDWLTKIIVGLGLINLVKIPGKLSKLGTYLAGKEGNPVVAATVVVYFASVGFLVGYLLTRLYLAGAFRRADQEREKTTNMVNLLFNSIPTRPFERAELIGSMESSFDELIPVSARSAGLAAYSRFEAELRGVASSNQLDPSKAPTSIVKELVAKTDLREDAIRFVSEIQSIRNQMAHGQDDAVTEVTARKFVQSLGNVMQLLEDASQNSDDASAVPTE